MFVLRLGVFASATKDQSITPRDELWFGETQRKRINSRFQKTPKRRKRGEREREREENGCAHWTWWGTVCGIRSRTQLWRAYLPPLISHLRVFDLFWTTSEKLTRFLPFLFVFLFSPFFFSYHRDRSREETKITSTPRGWLPSRRKRDCRGK